MESPAELVYILKDDAVKVLHSTYQQIWKTQQWPQDWKRSVFIPIPKKGNAKECSVVELCSLHMLVRLCLLKILQARLQQYMNWELPDVQAGFRKGRGIRDQITNIRWIIEKARELQRNICFIDSPKVFDSGSQQTVENSERDGIPDHLTCLLRNQYASQEATVSTEHGTMDCFQTGKGVCQPVYCYPAY